MEMIKSKFEIFHIAKSVGLPFERFYFVIYSLCNRIRNVMLEIIKNLIAIFMESQACFDKLPDS